MRRGMTLVEVMVVGALAVVLTGALCVVQQSASRHSVTTDRKRDAMVRAHRSFEAIHQVLASSPSYRVTTPPPAGEVARPDPDDDFDAPAPVEPDPALDAPAPAPAADAPPSHELFTPDGALRFDAQTNRLTLPKTSIDGIGAVEFHPAGGDLVAFTVDSGRSGQPDRERSQLYGKQFFEVDSDRRLFAAWGRPAALDNPCGYNPPVGKE